jgi:hypothetical protein
MNHDDHRSDQPDRDPAGDPDLPTGSEGDTRAGAAGAGESGAPFGLPVLAELPELAGLLEDLVAVDRLLARVLDTLVLLDDTGQVEAATGVGVSQWLAVVARRTGADVRMLRCAVRACRRLPALFAGFRDGRLSWAQLRVVALKVDRAPQHTDLALDAKVADAIDTCRDAEPDALARMVGWAIAELADPPDPADKPAAPALGEGFFHLQPRLDGTGGTVFGDLDAYSFALLDAHTAPTAAPTTGPTRTGFAGPTDPTGALTPPRRWGVNGWPDSSTTSPTAAPTPPNLPTATTPTAAMTPPAPPTGPAAGPRAVGGGQAAAPRRARHPAREQPPAIAAAHHPRRRRHAPRRPGRPPARRRRRPGPADRHRPGPRRRRRPAEPRAARLATRRHPRAARHLHRPRVRPGRAGRPHRSRHPLGRRRAHRHRQLRPPVRPRQPPQRTAGWKATGQADGTRHWHHPRSGLKITTHPTTKRPPPRPNHPSRDSGSSGGDDRDADLPVFRAAAAEPRARGSGGREPPRHPPPEHPPDG